MHKQDATTHEIEKTNKNTLMNEIEENVHVLERLIMKYGFYRSLGNIIESEKSQLKAKLKKISEL